MSFTDKEIEKNDQRKKQNISTKLDKLDKEMQIDDQLVIEESFFSSLKDNCFQCCSSTRKIDNEEQYEQEIVCKKSERTDIQLKQNKYNMYFRKLQRNNKDDQMSDITAITKVIMKKQRNWKTHDDNILIQLFTKHQMDFDLIVKEYNQMMEQSRTKNQIVTRLRKLRPEKFSKRKIWTEEEDIKLLNLIKIHGENWNYIQKLMKDRSSKQIRERYMNHLDPSIIKEPWTLDEDVELIKLYTTYGKKWSHFSVKLKGRSENMIKNRFNSFIKKVYDLEKINQDKQNIYVSKDVSQQMLQGFYNDKQYQLTIEQLILTNQYQNDSCSNSGLSNISYKSNERDCYFYNQGIREQNLNQMLDQNEMDNDLLHDINYYGEMEVINNPHDYYKGVEYFMKQSNPSRSNENNSFNYQNNNEYTFKKTINNNQVYNQKIYVLNTAQNLPNISYNKQMI